MNYEVKSAREASLQEIFYDKNTNKLSYKDKLGIITLIDSSSMYNAAILDTFPFVVFPNLFKTNTAIKQTAEGTSFGYNNTLEEYNVNGIIAFTLAAPTDVIYLGTLENLDILIAKKLSGNVETFDPGSGAYINSALCNTTTAIDELAGSLVAVKDTQIVVDYFAGGADLYLIYRASTLDDISMLVSFEYSFLTTGTTPTFTYY